MKEAADKGVEMLRLKSFHGAGVSHKCQALYFWLHICKYKGSVTNLQIDYSTYKKDFLGISSFEIPYATTEEFTKLFQIPYQCDTNDKAFWRRYGLQCKRENQIFYVSFNQTLYNEMHQPPKPNAAQLLTPLQTAAMVLLSDVAQNVSDQVQAEQVAKASVAVEATPAVGISPIKSLEPKLGDIDTIKRMTDSAYKARLEAQNEAAAEIEKAEALEAYAKALEDLDTEHIKLKKAKTRTEEIMAKIAVLEAKK